MGMQVHEPQITKLDAALEDELYLPKKFVEQAYIFLSGINPLKISIYDAKKSADKMILKFLIKNGYAENVHRHRKKLSYEIPIKHGRCFSKSLWDVLCFPLENVRVSSQAYTFMNEKIDDIYRNSFKV